MNSFKDLIESEKARKKKKGFFIGYAWTTDEVTAWFKKLKRRLKNVG